MIREDKYIRFDWAMKRLLRNKANFAVLEGLLTTLLGEKITIRRLLESESNQEEEFDKYNRVDMLAEDANGQLLLIEVQNNNEYAYFQRMLFGTSKLVTEYIKPGRLLFEHPKGLQCEHCLFQLRARQRLCLPRENRVQGHPSERCAGTFPIPKAEVPGRYGEPALSGILHPESE